MKFKNKNSRSKRVAGDKFPHQLTASELAAKGQLKALPNTIAGKKRENEDKLERARRDLSSSARARSLDGTAINWDAITDGHGGKGFYQTKMKVKRKYYKRFSKE